MWGGGGGVVVKVRLRVINFASYKQIFTFVYIFIFSSAVPPGSGAFQMPTCPSSSAASASTLRQGGGGGRANLRNASVIFSLFLHEVSLG